MFSANEPIPAAIQERRLFDRFVARLPVKLDEAEQNFSADVYLRDVSATGAKLVTRERLIPEDNVNFWVRVPDGKDPLHLKGRVVWAKEVGMDVWDAGINFDKVRLMNLHRVFSL